MPQFRKNHRYIFIGPKDFHVNWNERMDAWKDGMARVAIDVRSGNYAGFNDVGGRCWSYNHCPELFMEVDGSLFDSLKLTFSSETVKDKDIKIIKTCLKGKRADPKQCENCVMKLHNYDPICQSDIDNIFKEDVWKFLDWI